MGICKKRGLVHGKNQKIFSGVVDIDNRHRGRGGIWHGDHQQSCPEQGKEQHSLRHYQR